MDPTLYDAILQAQSPDQMKAAVVAALRALEADAKPPADPWVSGWGAPATQAAAQHAIAGDGYSKPAFEPAERYRSDSEARRARLERRLELEPRRARMIELVEEQLALANDGDEAQALEAKLRLLREDGGEAEQLVDEGARVTSSYDGGDIMVELPPPTDEQRAKWFAWAMERNLADFLPVLGSREAAAQAYAAGGPMWLYLQEAGRDALLAMPAHWRRDFVEHVGMQSQAEAHNVGRDILKQEDALDLTSPNAQRALSDAEANFNG